MLVVGDLMLDRYLVGEVARISPEAPVPVVLLERETTSVGGAGNVVLNLTGLGVQADVAGWTGDDPDGAHLRNLLGDAGVRVHGIESVRGRPTTTKTRVLSRHQQLVRIDAEETEARSPAERERWDRRIVEMLDDGYDALVLSDYAKGVLETNLCRALIGKARERGVPVLVDPKGLDYAKYAGATTVTPNEGELMAAIEVTASESEALTAAAAALREVLELEFVTLTRGEEGITVVDSTGRHHIPARAREVFDVSGAGDTVIATLAAAVAVGIGRRDAAVLANLAAGITVGHTGTMPISQTELLEALGPAEPELADKVMDLSAAVEAVDRWRDGGAVIGFTNGCFDLLHPGHVTSLHWAKRHCDRLVVGINTDASTRALKGEGRPVNAEAARAAVIAGLASVDAVVSFDDATPINVILALRPEVLVKGAAYTDAEIVGAPEVLGWGGQVLRAPMFEGHSTTKLLDHFKPS